MLALFGIKELILYKAQTIPATNIQFLHWQHIKKNRTLINKLLFTAQTHQNSVTLFSYYALFAEKN